MRPETQKASAPARERWQGFLFGRLVLRNFRRQDVPAQVLLNSALRSFQSDDPQMARQVEPLEETMDLLTEEIRSRHIRRLQSGQCTIQLGFILNDLLNNAERVGDHCSNIAVSVIEEQEKQAASHAYLHSLKKNDEFSFQLQQNLSRYVLPAETAEDQPAE